MRVRLSWQIPEVGLWRGGAIWRRQRRLWQGLLTKAYPQGTSRKQDTARRCGRPRPRHPQHRTPWSVCGAAVRYGAAGGASGKDMPTKAYPQGTSRKQDTARGVDGGPEHAARNADHRGRSVARRWDMAPPAASMARTARTRRVRGSRRRRTRRVRRGGRTQPSTAVAGGPEHAARNTDRPRPTSLAGQC